MKTLDVILFSLLAVSVTACSEAEFKGQGGNLSTTRFELDANSGGTLKLEVAPQGHRIKVGQSVSYEATAVYSDQKKEDVSKSVIWSVSLGELAEISSAGVLTATRSGDVVVTATFNQISTSANLIIEDADLTEIRVMPGRKSVLIGDIVNYQATGIYSDLSEADLTGKVGWSTDNENIVSFASNASLNQAKALELGDAKIIATYQQVEGNAILDVNPAVPEKLEIDPKNFSVPSGQTVQYKAMATFSDGTIKEVTDSTEWKSSDEPLAAFGFMNTPPNLATTFKKGVVLIKAKYHNVEAETNLTVSDAIVESVLVRPNTASVKVGETFQFKAEATYSDKSVMDVTPGSVWTSTNPAVATVTNGANSSGRATGVNPGDSKVYAVYNQIKSNEASLNVKPLDMYLLSVSKNGSGTVAGLGINCGTDCEEKYVVNTNVDLIATPSANYNFTGWGGACTGLGVCKVSMTAAKSVVANFSLKTFILSVVKTGNGTVSGNGVSCGTDCSETFIYNSFVTLTAVADSDSLFVGWGGDCSGTGSCSVNMTAAKTVTALFRLKTFTLTVNKTGNGLGDVSGSGISCGTDCSEIYDYGSAVILTVSPNASSIFTGWSGACTGTGSCIVTMNQARAVTANFSIDCDKNSVENVAETFRTPLTRAYQTGDMNRRNLDGTPDKGFLQGVVNQRCIDNYDPTVTSVRWTNPALSSDTATRDAICQLYGYQRATGAFGYYGLASPSNDHAANWSNTVKRMLVNLDASGSPTHNKILVWTECTGKLYNTCTNKFVSDFRCKN